jgi:D-specific alpha-keto acid dehydrogenase
MTYREPLWTACAPKPAIGVTIYGCDQDEASLFRAVAPRYGVAPRITGAPVSETNLDLTAGNRCISVGHKARITQAILPALHHAGVEYISTRSAGLDHIDVDFAQQLGISVGNVAYSPDSVADYTVMLMLMAARNARALISRAETYDYRLSAVRGKELRDLTVGVVGMGRIGTAVVTRLRGFGCRVLAYDTHPTNAAPHVPLEQLLRCSDIVTLHTPLTADTHHMLNRRNIARMKPGAIVINTGRGSLVDTQALITALEAGRLGGAALDVVEGEEGVFYTDRRHRPVECDALVRLQHMPNVLISPHTAFHTERALCDTVENTIINCLRFERGEPAWTR